MFNGFLQELGSLKNSELSFPFRNQFKIKENFINPNSKHFDSIAQKLLSEEKASIKRKWDKQCKMMFIWILGKFFQLKNKKTINPTLEEWGQLSNILKIDEVTLKQRWITLTDEFNLVSIIQVVDLTVLIQFLRVLIGIQKRMKSYDRL